MQVWENESQHSQMIFPFWKFHGVSKFGDKSKDNKQFSISAFFRLLERSWNMHINDELTFSIKKFIAWFMGKKIWPLKLGYAKVMSLENCINWQNFKNLKLPPRSFKTFYHFDATFTICHIIYYKEKMNKVLLSPGHCVFYELGCM